MVDGGKSTALCEDNMGYKHYNYDAISNDVEYVGASLVNKHMTPNENQQP